MPLVPARAAAARVRGRICTWAETYHANGPLDGARDLAGFGDGIQDLRCGAEVTQQPDSIVGFTLGLGQQRLSNFSFASRRLTSDALFAGLYGTHGMGQWQAAGLVGYSRFDIGAERGDIAVGAIRRQARASYGGNGLNAATTLRHRTELGDVSLAPEGLVAFAQYWKQGFTKAGALNLRMGRSSSNSRVTGLSATASTDIVLGGVKLLPYATLRYDHDWLAGALKDHRVTASLAEMPQARILDRLRTEPRPEEPHWVPRRDRRRDAIPRAVRLGGRHVEPARRRTGHRRRRLPALLRARRVWRQPLGWPHSRRPAPSQSTG